MRLPVDRRTVVVLLAVAAVVVVVFLQRDPGDPAGSASDPVPSETAGLPPVEPTAPTEPVTPTFTSFDEFCTAFLALVDAHSQNVATGNDGLLEQVRVAGDALLAVGEGVPMTDSVRAGFAWFVADTMREDLPEVTSQDQADFSAFLGVACPA